MVYTKISNDETLAWLKGNLTPKRYEHSLGTAQCAQLLAKKFNLNEEKAYIAGLLHDCAKCFDNDKMLEIMNNYLDVSEDEMVSWKTWHAPVSSYIAKTVFGINDEEILSAIRWHTIGKLDMTDFEKIIFLADKIEPRTRVDDYAKPIRECLQNENNLDKAMFICYKQTIESLARRELKISYSSVQIYNKLLDVN